jgi:predicted DNA-binding transcriptional regulator YafY
MRTFRVDSVQQVAPEDDCFSRPRGFSVREYLERTMRDSLPFTIEIHLASRAADVVRDSQGHWMEISDHADGSITTHFGAVDLNWVTGWVLSFGALAKVVKPPELVTRVRAAAEGALTRY